MSDWKHVSVGFASNEVDDGRKCRIVRGGGIAGCSGTYRAAGSGAPPLRWGLDCLAVVAIEIVVHNRDVEDGSVGVGEEYGHGRRSKMSVGKRKGKQRKKIAFVQPG